MVCSGCSTSPDGSIPVVASKALQPAGSPSPRDAVASLRARVTAFAAATLTDDLCVLAARVA
jgi:hypothetical protein